MTLVCADLDNVPNYFLALNDFVREFRKSSITTVLNHGYLVPTNIFPKVIKDYTDLIWSVLEQYMMWYGSSIDVEQRETMVLLERLVLMY